jgi:hypothetical protein
MTQFYSRRRTLQASGTVLAMGLTGCTFGSNTTKSGTLVLDNEQDRSWTVTVSVSKISNDDDDGPARAFSAPPPTTTPIWNQEYSYEVSADGRKTIGGFISEEGAYYIVVRLNTEVENSTWFSAYSAAGGVGGGYVSVTIQEEGGLFVSTGHDD